MNDLDKQELRLGVSEALASLAHLITRLRETGAAGDTVRDLDVAAMLVRRVGQTLEGQRQ